MIFSRKIFIFIKYDKTGMIIDMNIVIVCWNALKYTENTVFSLLNTIGRDEEVHVTFIDNGSNDATLIFLQNLILPENISRKIITNSRNLGIGAAYNQGLAESVKIGAKYTVFANNDLQFMHGWLTKMRKIMDDNPKMVVLSPLKPSAQDFYDKSRSTREVLKSLTETGSPEDEIRKFIGEKCVNLYEFSQKIEKINREKYGTSLREITFPNAASSSILVTQTDFFAKLGYFANPIFASNYGGEDIDMCWRALKMGREIAITNDVYIHHFRGKSIKSAGLDRAKMLAKSNVKLREIWGNDLKDFMFSHGISRENIPDKPEYWLIRELFEKADLQ